MEHVRNYNIKEMRGASKPGDPSLAHHTQTFYKSICDFWQRETAISQANQGQSTFRNFCYASGILLRV